MNDQLPADEVLKPAEVARYLKISPAQCYNLLKRNEIPNFKIGTAGRRVRRADLMAWINRAIAVDTQ